MLSPRPCHPLAPHPSLPIASSPGIIATFITGPRATAMGQVAPAVRRQAVLDDLALLLGKEALDPIDYTGVCGVGAGVGGRGRLWLAPHWALPADGTPVRAAAVHPAPPRFTLLSLLTPFIFRG